MVFALNYGLTCELIKKNLYKTSIFVTNSIYGKRDDSYSSLFFSFNHFSFFSSSNRFALLFKMTSRKDTCLNYLEFSKNQTKSERLAGSQNPTKEKFALNPAFIYSRKLIWGNSKKAAKLS